MVGSQARENKTARRALERKKAGKTKITGKVALELYLQSMQVPLLFLARYGPNQIKPVLKYILWAPLFHPLHVHLVIKELHCKETT